MKSAIAFFHELEEKKCVICGGSMVEQAESYMTECFHCHDQLINQSSSSAR